MSYLKLLGSDTPVSISDGKILVSGKVAVGVQNYDYQRHKNYPASISKIVDEFMRGYHDNVGYVSPAGYEVSLSVGLALDTDTRVKLKLDSYDIRTSLGSNIVYLNEHSDTTELEEMNKELQAIESELDKYTNDESRDIYTRYAHITESETNGVILKSSLSTDLCFITTMKLALPDGNPLEYLVMDSESVMHSKSENVLDHDYTVLDKASGTDSRLNGHVYVISKGDTVSVVNTSRSKGNPESLPVVITAVRNDFKYYPGSLQVSSESGVIYDLQVVPAEGGDAVEIKVIS